MAISDTLKRDDAEQEDAEIQMDQVQLLKDEAVNTFDDLIEMFEKAPITDDNDEVIATLENHRREKQFLWLRVTRDFDKKFFPKKKKQAEDTEEEEASSTASKKKNKTVVGQEESSDDDSVVPLQKGVRLAKLQDFKLLLFFGNRLEWTRFWEVFDSHVHKRSDLDTITKFSHLVNCLKSDAARFVAGYAVTSANYPKVIEALKKEYGREDIIIEAHFEKLLGLVDRKPAHNDAAFRDLYLEAASHARALEALGVKPTGIKSIIQTVLVSKMPSDLKLMWYRVNKQNPTMEELFEFIDSELAARNRMRVSNKPSTHHQEKQHYDEDRDRGSRSRPTLSALTASASRSEPEKPSQCMFCSKNDHRTGACRTTIKQRKEWFFKHDRCFRCSRQGHKAEDCDKVCFHCEGDHHIYICETKGAEFGLLAISQTTTTVLKTFCVTAHGPMGEKKVRILLDGGSHSSYITEDAATSLGLQSSTKKHWTVNVVGGETVTRTVATAMVKLKTNKTELIEISCVQMPQICQPLPAISIGDWREKMLEQQFQPADGIGKEENWNGQVDLLIGAADYYSIVTGRSSRINSNLMAIETAFGWILHGKIYQECPNNLNVSEFKSKGPDRNHERFLSGEDTCSSWIQQQHSSQQTTINNVLDAGAEADPSTSKESDARDVRVISPPQRETKRIAEACSRWTQERHISHQTTVDSNALDRGAESAPATSTKPDVRKERVYVLFVVERRRWVQQMDGLIQVPNKEWGATTHESDHYKHREQQTAVQFVNINFLQTINKVKVKLWGKAVFLWETSANYKDLLTKEKTVQSIKRLTSASWLIQLMQHLCKEKDSALNNNQGHVPLEDYGEVAGADAEPTTRRRMSNADGAETIQLRIW